MNILRYLLYFLRYMNKFITIQLTPSKFRTGSVKPEVGVVNRRRLSRSHTPESVGIIRNEI